ncbi:MAG: hypothetical protein LR015_10780 [Verrucomicrobia bacterium]|nr:hypothetical protein [Verrucomicrobiota bacterium]
MEAIGSKAIDFLHTKLIVGEVGIPGERTGRGDRRALARRHHTAAAHVIRAQCNESLL